MIRGIGVDSIEIARIRTALDRPGFQERIYTPQELSQISGAKAPARLAALFAAKEAVFKAFGTGLKGHTWHDVEVLHLPSGSPVVRLHNQALITAQKLEVVNIHISLSHDRQRALAFCVLEGGET